jgi:hypothetical protein
MEKPAAMAVTDKSDTHVCIPSYCFVAAHWIHAVLAREGGGTVAIDVA